MKITILGSGAWEGVPAPFCRCGVCIEASKDPRSKNNRTRPQLLVENEEQNFLVEASPDIRVQSARFLLSPIRDFIISHWHFDHMYGLHELFAYSKYKAQGLNIYCSRDTKKVLEEEELSYVPAEVIEVEALEPFELAGIKVTPLPMYHMRDRDGQVADDQLANTFGYLFEHNGKRVAYLADYYQVPQAVKDLLNGVDAVVCDGTYLLTDEYKSYKPNHMHGEEGIEFAESLGAGLVYLDTPA